MKARFWAYLLMALPLDWRSDLQPERRVPFRSLSDRQDGPGRCSQARCGRGTDSPPVSPRQGSAITSASRFTGASLIPRIRNHDRVYVIAPVTVGQVTPAASGRCHPALTGVGVVPWIQSRPVTAVPSA